MTSDQMKDEGKKKPTPSTSDAFSGFSSLNRALLDFEQHCRPVELLSARIPRLYGQIARTADIFRQNHIGRFLEEQRRFSEMMASSVRSANESLSRMTAGFAEIANLRKKMEELNRPWQCNLLRISEQMQRRLTVKDLVARQFSQAIRISIGAEAALSRFHGRAIGDLVGVTAAHSRVLSSRIMSVSNAYSQLVNRLNVERVHLLDLSSVILEHPPVEVFNVVGLAQSVTEVEADAEVEEIENDVRKNTTEVVKPSLEVALSSINPDLRNLWEGAQQMLTSTNPDRKRHLAASLRELFTHILHALSPDDRVRQWNSDPLFYRQDRPTRRARLLYICRGINQEEFRHFVNKDVEALLAFTDLFQQGTHDVAPPFSDEQLKALLYRTESAVLFLINISQST